MFFSADVYGSLALCVVGVYSMFLVRRLPAVVLHHTTHRPPCSYGQSRKSVVRAYRSLPIHDLAYPSPVSVPFQSVDGTSADKFESPLFMGTCQSALSALSALLYLFVRRKPHQTLTDLLGLSPPLPAAQTNGHSLNGHAKHKPDTRWSARALLLRYLQCALFITSAAPFGFAALSHISYPAMVLGKSCKLVPVMLMNVLLYRRAFAPHKYLVVALVTAGITLFMAFGSSSSSKKHASSATGVDGHPALRHNALGIAYLLVNLALAGATNSTPDEIFARHRVSGQQMMLWINVFCTLLTAALSVLPLPHIPVLHPSAAGTAELSGALAFVRAHPSVVSPLAQFALTGALGQLFIFETLQHFGSLTLVYVALL